MMMMVMYFGGLWWRFGMLDMKVLELSLRRRLD